MINENRNENTNWHMTQRYIMESRIRELEEENEYQKQYKLQDECFYNGVFLGFFIGTGLCALLLMVVA
jgi:hypothetical protein